jgi:hypothetical protein
MNSKYENARLVLRTIDIQMYGGGAYDATLNNVDNEFGTIQSRGQYLVWKNINIKALLGELWDKYTMFNLSLRTVCKSCAIFNNNAHQHTIWMTGLNWINRSYSIVTKTQNREACVGASDLLAGSNTAGTVIVSHFTKYAAMFRKGNPIVDLSIQLKNSDGTVYNNNDGRIEIASTISGHMDLIFEIYGVKGYEVNPNQIQIRRSVPISYDFNSKPRFNTPNYVL